MNQTQLKDAIAEAKTIRETAIANAKLALQEAFTPKIQSMLSTKLQEMEEADEVPTEEVAVEDEVVTDEPVTNSDSTEITEEELDSILAELELDETGKETVEEVTDVTQETEETLEEEIDIDTLLQEIDLEEAKKKKDAEDKEDKEDKKDKKDDKKSEKKSKDEDVDLESLSIKDLKDLIKDIVADVVGEKGEEAPGEELPAMDAPVEEVPSEEVPLEELGALEEIKELRQELNEVNLLNSKLLYVSKLLKENNLSEAQKIKIVDTFDKATSVKETKLVYETLKEAFVVKTKSTKSSINESVKLGFASKPTGAKAKPIVETNDIVSRFQKLAGIE